MKNLETVKTASPCLFRLISMGMLDAEVVRAFDNVIDAARRESYEYTLEHMRGPETGQTYKALDNPQTPHPGFLVWNPRNGPPFYTHDSLVSAQTEAKRLAVKVPATPFYVMAPVGAAFADISVLPVKFNAVNHVSRSGPVFDHDDEIPF